MHESRDEHVYCNTDTERAKLVRVKATVSIPPLHLSARNMHEKTQRNICAHCCTGSTQLQKYFIQPRALGTLVLPVVMTRERNNCSLLMHFSRKPDFGMKSCRDEVFKENRKFLSVSAFSENPIAQKSLSIMHGFFFSFLFFRGFFVHRVKE